jgi:3'-phosphoadenosine 5'-phosphosulfate sulfotransferase (PAPS reductase)/FAD synthetase
MDNLVKTTVDRMQRWHRRWPKAAVLWSGGKDSTALLHVLKFKAGIDVPVIQYREPKLRERYAYSDKLVKEWGLEMYDYPPTRVAVADGPDVETGEMRFDMLKYYQWGSTAVVMSLGTERPTKQEIESGKYLCGVTDFLHRPTGTFNFPWEAVFIGTKGHDTDLIKGEIPLAMDVRAIDGAPVNLYPLKDWSDGDVYRYLESESVEVDPTRYVKRDGEWGNNPNKSLNADFYPICFNCVDRHQGRHVHCPKLAATVSNVSHHAPYEDMVFPDLGFKPIWNTTANDAGLAARTSGAGPSYDETDLTLSASRNGCLETTCH